MAVSNYKVVQKLGCHPVTNPKRTCAMFVSGKITTHSLEDLEDLNTVQDLWTYERHDGSKLNNDLRHSVSDCVVVGNVGGQMVTMHDFIMKTPTGFMVEHLDGNKLNNCRLNLRLVPISKGDNMRIQSTMEYEDISNDIRDVVKMNVVPNDIYFDPHRNHFGFHTSQYVEHLAEKGIKIPMPYNGIADHGFTKLELLMITLHVYVSIWTEFTREFPEKAAKEQEESNARATNAMVFYKSVMAVHKHAPDACSAPEPINIDVFMTEGAKAEKMLYRLMDIHRVTLDEVARYSAMTPKEFELHEYKRMVRALEEAGLDCN